MGFEFWVGVAGCSDCLRLGVVLGWFRVWGCRGFRACGRPLGVCGFNFRVGCVD